MRLTNKEAGRLTYKQFKDLYKAYKDTFDLELLLTLSRKTYAKIEKEAEAGEEWLS